MTEVLQFPSPSSCSLNPNDSSHQTTTSLITINNHDHSHFQIQHQEQQQQQEQEEKDQLSILTLLIATFRKSLIGCSSTGAAAGEISSSSSSSMEIGWPSNVRHVAHVTFDRFHGFLGLPVEFEPEVPTRPPSARFISFLFYQFLFQLGFL
jgi:hypothetical protein